MRLRPVPAEAAILHSSLHAKALDASIIIVPVLIDQDSGKILDVVDMSMYF